MKMYFRFSLLLSSMFLAMGSPITGYGQEASHQGGSPYILRVKKEVLLVSAGGLSAGVGTYLYRNTPDILLSDVRLREISKFDRVATEYDSEAAASASDVFLYGSMVLPFSLLLDSDVRQHAAQVGVMYAEVALITTGLTTLIKSTAQRPRPYLYEEGLPGSTVLNANDRAAFLSGHASAAAAGSFFIARVYSDFHPDVPGRWIVWGAAVSIPAVTAFLRVRAGRHYPTDVIAGYALGAIVGAGVPTLHRRAKAVLPEGLSITAGRRALYASYTF